MWSQLIVFSCSLLSRSCLEAKKYLEFLPQLLFIDCECGFIVQLQLRLTQYFHISL